MRLEGYVKKGWGHELIWASTEKYCGKKMVFDRVGAKFSMHFHTEKDESWVVDQGRFLLRWIDTRTAKIHEQILVAGDTWHNPPNLPHQLEALEANSIITEVSTTDSVEDNYRIFPGDSQSDSSSS
jgi:mannose-6-phosphate isomerase